MEFLLEINTEEMPPLHIGAALKQLETNLKAELVSHSLVDNRGNWGKIDTYGTSRRLIVHGKFVSRQKSKEVKITGPPKSAAFTPDGLPTQAALGFAKSQGVKVEDLEVIKDRKGEYVGVVKAERGRPIQEILPDILSRVISQISFPKMMKWGESNFRFSRPIKNILCILNGKTLLFEVGGVNSTNWTTGHVLVSPERIRIKSFRDFREQLKKNSVIISKQTRKTRIEKQMIRKLTPLEAEYYPDEQLLNKLAMDVEYPYVFMGTFPEEYLKLPLEVLSTAMREGQSLFSVVKGRKQLPIFLGVTDGCEDTRSLVRKGNERVLKARLEDARFFWENDLKIPLKERYAELARVVYQEKLGSYEDKSERLKKITGYLAHKLEAQKEKRPVIEAAGLCKTDLLTDLVREFPSLQGKAGGLYARKEGLPVMIWKTIYEHYQPINPEDATPSSLTGTILSICDKLDSVVGVMGLGIEATGSKDPFGLRRNAQGICTVILDKRLNFSFPRLLDKVIAVYENKLDVSKDELKSSCLEFFKSRLQYIFERQGYRYDLVNAALAPGLDNIFYISLRLKALDGLKDSPQFEPMIIIAKRVNNILRDQAQFKLNTSLFYEKEERDLYTTYTIIKKNVLPFITRGDYAKAQRILFKIRSSVDNFFDNVLVMDKNIKLRRNRLALLQAVSKLFVYIADYSQIVIEG
jgi:glycyl-tRNA synthetase beta chain